MAIGKRRPNKQPEYLAKPDAITGTWMGTYIGVVRVTVDRERLGRLLVYIPQIAPRDEENHWISVSYATPFYGVTDPKYTVNEKEPVNRQNTFEEVKHSYGMWFVPPDPGVKVLVTFVNGDVNNGYWFACLPDTHNHFMVPSLGATKHSTYESVAQADRPDQVPTAEYNDDEAETKKAVTWTTVAKPLHKTQFNILQNQGLEFDYYRGAIRSGSQRQTPSTTFGISTPGRPNPDTVADNPSKLSSLTEADVVPKSRKGGHTFVMDDGDIVGKDNFFRLRTGAGHQILMHDTGKFIYITNSSGTSWIELNDKGDIEIFAEGYFNLRSAQSINLHADQKINMYAGTGINIATEQDFNTDSRVLFCKTSGVLHLYAQQNLLLKTGAALNFEASSSGSMKSSGQLSLEGSIINLNSGGTTAVQTLPGIQRKPFPNSVKVGNRYKTIQNRITSIVDRVPIHEPDPGHLAIVTQTRATATTTTPAEVGRDSGRVPSTPVSSSNKNAFAKQSGTGFDATKTPASGKLKTGNLKSYLATQPPTGKAVGSLSLGETTATKISIGHSESRHNYQSVNPYGYAGKYQFGAMALADNGYIKPDMARQYGNRALNMPEAWTEKAKADGIRSRQDFLDSPAVQEKVMESNMQLNYDRMRKSGAIRADDDPATVSGMLHTAHLLGAGGARKWRETGQGADANNTTGKVYNDRGKYAIKVLTDGDGNLIS